jgi:hypothetical protein
MKATIAQMLDAAIKMAERRGTPDVIFVAHETVRNFLKAQRPAVYDLYSAAWRAGYTVNGIRPLVA